MKFSLFLTAGILGTTALAAWFQHRAAATGLAGRDQLRAEVVRLGIDPDWLTAQANPGILTPWKSSQVIAKGTGVLIWWGMAVLAQLQILVSDYVQHYGLRRAPLPDGRMEPVGPTHSWNSGPWFSSALMLNAPRHSDHHSHPSRPYPALRLGAEDEAPRLPWPLPLACTIALIPPLWKRAIRPALRRWQTIAPDQKVTQG